MKECVIVPGTTKEKDRWIDEREGVFQMESGYRGVDVVILSSSVFFNRRRALGGTGAGPDRDAYQQKNGSHGRPSRITLSAWASASRACRWYQYCAHISKDDERHTTPSTRSWPTGTGTGAAEVNAATTSCYQLSISSRCSSLLTGDDDSNDCKLHTDSSCV